MNKSYILTVILAALAAIAFFNYESAPAGYSFEQYKADYQKFYSREGEEAYRKSIFLRNIVRIAEHNANSDNTYQIGINQFTDLTDVEFKSIYLTLNVPERNIEVLEGEFTPNADIDWQSAQKVSPVKNQGSCGSCWAFSAVAALESAFLIKHGSTAYLSEQQLVDCSRSYGNQGCNGGWMDSAFQYIRDKGLSTQEQYPYVARDQNCKIDNGAHKVTGFVDVPGCDNLWNSLSARPVSVAVDASNWSPYKSGILSTCGLAVNHGVLLIGATDGYWRIKNSWGTGWGETGFIRLSRGNTCAICNYPSYPTI